MTAYASEEAALARAGALRRGVLSATDTFAPVVFDAATTALARFWSDPPPDRFNGKPPARIAGGQYDAAVPDGTLNPYWQIVRDLPLDSLGPLPWRTRPEPNGHWYDPARSLVLPTRDVLVRSYSWSIPSPADIAWMTTRLDGRGLVETGAGGGYWAWQLAQAGADAVAYDVAPAPTKWALTEWHPVLRDDASAAGRHPDRALFLCWPTYDEPWAAHALACYQGKQLFYAGEGAGGCCADDEFFALLDAEWEEASESAMHISFWGIHCHLTEYRRKAGAP